MAATQLLYCERPFCRQFLTMVLTDSILSGNSTVMRYIPSGSPSSDTVFPTALDITRPSVLITVILTASVEAYKYLPSDITSALFPDTGIIPVATRVNASESSEISPFAEYAIT